MFRNAEQNLLGGGLGFFYKLINGIINGIYENLNGSFQNWFSIESFLLFSLGTKKAFLKDVDKVLSNLCWCKY